MLYRLREKRRARRLLAAFEDAHGFRRAENIKRSLDGELYFYSRIFAFDFDSVEPLSIENV